MNLMNYLWIQIIYLFVSLKTVFPLNEKEVVQVRVLLVVIKDRIYIFSKYHKYDANIL
jgi:hypothetical protein